MQRFTEHRNFWCLEHVHVICMECDNEISVLLALQHEISKFIGFACDAGASTASSLCWSVAMLAVASFN